MVQQKGPDLQPKEEDSNWSVISTKDFRIHYLQNVLSDMMTQRLQEGHSIDKTKNHMELFSSI